MKAVILIFAFTVLLIAASLTIVNGQNKSVTESPKEKSLVHEEKFKKVSEEKIIKNQKKIAEIKVEKSRESKKVNGRYDKKVLTLEQKNSALKKRTETNSTNNRSIWELIKHAFSLDVEALAIIESGNIMK